MLPKLLLQKTKTFLSRYPAVVAGVIIFSYFLFTTFDLFQKTKKSALDAFDYLKQFDTLLWMWLLAWVLIKIIQYRSKLQEQERIRFRDEQDIQLRQAQITSMVEIVRKLQHDLNNPLTILLAYLQKAERAAKDSPEVKEPLKQVQTAAERIFQTLSDFSKSKAYDLENTLAADDNHENTSRVDETGAARG